MIKEYIRLRTLAAAVHMQKYSPAIFINFAVFPIKLIDFCTTLLQTSYLIQRNGISHTSFPLAVGQVAVIANPVFGILNDDTYFRPFLHQVTSKAQGNIIGILIFMQFHLSYFPDSSRVGTSMSADDIETRPLQAVRGHFHISKFFPEQTFTDRFFFISGRFGRNCGRSPFPQWG